MANGLDDVVAAETVLSDVDGLGGHLTIRGHALPELAGRWRYAQVIRLLLDGFFDDLPGDDELAVRLGEARVEVFERLTPSLPLLAPLEIYSAMRAGMALLPDGETLTDALRLIAAPAVLTPALLRLERGEQPIAPDAKADHAADMLRMLKGSVPSPALAKALDTYLVTVCDHGLNASTFATRVVASTQAGLTSAILAGLGALKGPLHGGAPGPVIEMLDAIEAHGDAAGWLRDENRARRAHHGLWPSHLPGARSTRRCAEGGGAATRRRGRNRPPAGLCRKGGADRARGAAASPSRSRSIQTNVEFYTALLLEAAGFPPRHSPTSSPPGASPAGSPMRASSRRPGG